MPTDAPPGDSSSATPPDSAGSATPPTPAPPKPDDSLGDAGKEAIRREREARSAAEKRAKDAEQTVAKMKAALDGKESAEQTATAAKAEAESATREAMRLRVAMSEGLPADLVPRLIGDTESELRDDAKRLAAMVKAGKPKSDAGSGTGRKDDTKPSNQDILRAAFGRG